MHAQNSIVWEVPLSDMPRILYAGIGRHGHQEPAHQYCYESAWCLHAYDYHGTIRIGENLHELTPGTISLVAPGVLLEHRWPGPDCVHSFAIFELEKQGAPSKKPVHSIVRPQRGFEAFKAAMSPIVYGATIDPRRSSVRLWDLLWTLTEIAESEASRPAQQSILETAHRWIQDHATESLNLSAMACHCGVSASHLFRLFRTEHGMGPAAWHRRQRLGRAIQLLCHSNLGVKEAAAENGFTDLQQFNKLVRKATGVPPRRLRLRKASARTEM